LHLHGLIFNRKLLSPQQIKDRLLDPNSPFQQQLIAHIDSIRKGEFFAGTKEDVRSLIEKLEQIPGYISPERTLPVSAPASCNCDKEHCSQCLLYQTWLQTYHTQIDDILFKSNLHNC
ncbi:hypothetical protein EV361DRAFT_766898, partial [Lentinula raphanica]